MSTCGLHRVSTLRARPDRTPAQFVDTFDGQGCVTKRQRSRKEARNAICDTRHLACVRSVFRPSQIGTLAVMSDTDPAETADDRPADPHLWLEDVTGEPPLAWARERNAATQAAVAASGSFEALQERLRGILDTDARIPMPRR